MGLTARLQRRYRVKAVCDDCGQESIVQVVEHKREAYETLRVMGWELHTAKKEALCKKCRRG